MIFVSVSCPYLYPCPYFCDIEDYMRIYLKMSTSLSNMFFQVTSIVLYEIIAFGGTWHSYVSCFIKECNKMTLECSQEVDKVRIYVSRSPDIKFAAKVHTRFLIRPENRWKEEEKGNKNEKGITRPCIHETSWNPSERQKAICFLLGINHFFL